MWWFSNQWKQRALEAEQCLRAAHARVMTYGDMVQMRRDEKRVRKELKGAQDEAAMQSLARQNAETERDQLKDEQREIARIFDCPDLGDISTPSNLPNLIRDQKAELAHVTIQRDQAWKAVDKISNTAEVFFAYVDEQAGQIIEEMNADTAAKTHGSGPCCCDCAPESMEVVISGVPSGSCDVAESSAELAKGETK